MILTISQYVEAITSPDGHLRTFQRLRPLYGESDVADSEAWRVSPAAAETAAEGWPHFTVHGHGLVDFEVVADGVPSILRCPLSFGTCDATRLRELAERERPLQSPFFTPWRLLERELLLFDGNGKGIEIDVLAHPAPTGRGLVDFVERALACSRRGLIAAAATSFEELCRWADGVGRSGITLHRLVVSREGAVSLKAFSANDERAAVAEMLRAALQRDPLPSEAEADNPPGYDFGAPPPRFVRDGGGWAWLDGRGAPLPQDVWLLTEPFRQGRAEIETPSGKGLIDSAGRAVVEPVYEELAWDELWGIAAVMIEGCWSIVDRDGVLLTSQHYDWLGECSEGMVLAVRNGKCGFIDISGSEAIPCIYDDASSFSEGCALVKHGGESFFIDSSGRSI